MRETSRVPRQPLPSKTVIKLLVLVILGLAYFAGYYHASYQKLQERYLQLETQCVKVEQP